MNKDDLKAILVAIMLSGYSGAGGFNDEQLEIAIEDVERIQERLTVEEP